MESMEKALLDRMGRKRRRNEGQRIRCRRAYIDGLMEEERGI
jgi:hypothetical protein